jgi:hypothetical protein
MSTSRLKTFSILMMTPAGHNESPGNLNLEYLVPIGATAPAAKHIA